MHKTAISVILNLCAICTLILLALGAARADEFQVKTITTKGFHADNLQLPYVESGNGATSMHINDYIYMEIVKVTAPENWGEFLTFPDEVVAGFYKLNYKVVRNDEKALSLKIMGMTCGSSCWPYHIYYNFDAKTGRRMRLGDLLMPEAVKKTNISFNKQLVVAAKKWNAKIQEEETKKHVDWREIELDYPVGGQAGIDWNPDFLIEGDKLSIYGAADYKGYEEYGYSIEMSKLEPLLTDYGKYIFLKGSEAIPERKDPYNKLLHGHIGSSAIQMRLNKQPSDKLIFGNYFYDKYRKLIELQGDAKDANRIELKEITSGNPVMSLTVDGEALTGKWILDKKTLEVEASPF